MDDWLYDGMAAQTWQPWVAAACAVLACAGAASLWRRMLRGVTDRLLVRRLWVGLAAVLVLLVATPWLRFAWLAIYGQVEETRLVSAELRRPGGYRRRYPICMAVVESDRHELWAVTLRREACQAASHGHTPRIPFVVADALRWLRQPGRHVLLPIGWLTLHAVTAGTLWLIALLVRWPQLQRRRVRPGRVPGSDADLVELARRAFSAHAEDAKFDAHLPEHARFVERTLFAGRPGDPCDVALFRIVQDGEPPKLDEREFWVTRRNDGGVAESSLVAGPFRL